jgi:CBS domain containing-hemolysin-like protein
MYGNWPGSDVSPGRLQIPISEVRQYQMEPYLGPFALAFAATLFFSAERCISLFTWSALEGLTSIKRARRQAAEGCLESRELVATTFSVVGALMLILTLVAMKDTPAWADQASWPAALEVVGGVVVLAWIIPEIVACTIRERMMLYIVPPLYAVFGLPFRALRNLLGLSSRNAAERGNGDAEASSEGVSSDAEAHEFFKEAVRLQHTPVREIMTPRTDMVSIAHTATLRQAAAVCMESGYSRFPIYQGNRDQIIGIIHVKDLLGSAGTDKWEASELQSLMREPFFVPETKTISDLLQEFQHSSTHIGVVLDEYGGTSGLVTLEDVLEELIGEIHDEHEDMTEEVPLFQRVSENTTDVQSVMRVEEFNEEFDFDLPDEEDFDTIGGFVTFVMGKIPAVGESFHYGRDESARFTILEADQRHVISVRVIFDEESGTKEKS